jgi:hypothetical protein
MYTDATLQILLSTMNATMIALKLGVGWKEMLWPQRWQEGCVVQFDRCKINQICRLKESWASDRHVDTPDQTTETELLHEVGNCESIFFRGFNVQHEPRAISIIGWSLFTARATHYGHLDLCFYSENNRRRRRSPLSKNAQRLMTFWWHGVNCGRGIPSGQICSPRTLVPSL